MDVVTSVEAMRERAREARRGGRRIAFVPTMGALHAGHLALLGAARSFADYVVISVFVNPLQFGPAEDFARYPRDLGRDRQLAASAGADVLWAPATDAMYPEPPRVTVAPGEAGDRFEGAARPGHFAGVLTVVLKLLSVVQPDVAVFGRKDLQQAALVRRMVRDFDLPVDIVVAATVREPDGLALSSRNAYLDPATRARAPVLARALARATDLFRGGERRAAAVAAAARAVLEGEPALAVEYVACVDPNDVRPVETVDAGTALVLAVRLGNGSGTRLIDNVILGAGLEGDGRIA